MAHVTCQYCGGMPYQMTFFSLSTTTMSLEALQGTTSMFSRVTRSGDFSPKNATDFGYFPANLQKFWAIFRQIAEVWAIPLQNSDFGIFWKFLATSGDTITIW